MARVNPWARHYQHPWLERVAVRRYPDWLRVACLAFGRHRGNGHAPFRPGEVALILGTPDPQHPTCVIPLDKHNLQRAIRSAVDNGWLAVGSGSTCLIVPGHAVTGGLGQPDEPCSRHGEVGR